MSDEFFRDEKDEKDEKEVSKHEEKTVDEKWRRDPLGTISWGLVLIWVGAALILFDNSNILDQIPILGQMGGNDWMPDVWSIIMFGAGLIFLLEAVLRLLIPAYHRPVFGTVLFALVLIGVSLGSAFNWNLFWPVILIFLGLSMILRKRPK